jgi:hypothetical protein
VTERSDLLASVANTIRDYRAGEVARPNPDHVDRWISQFDRAVQVPLLREIDRVLDSTYFSKADVREMFAHQVAHNDLAGLDPCDFWRTAHFLDIQQQGHSQEEIRSLFAAALTEECNGLDLEDCGQVGNTFVYMDDILFTGERIRNDLSAWIASKAPRKSTIHVLVMATHRYGEWMCEKRVNEAAAAAGREIDLTIWAAHRFENRKVHRNNSEVLWPTVVPDDGDLQAYIAEEVRFPFEPRQANGTQQHAIFSSEEGRQLLEREMLLAGMRIRSFSENPSPSLRPLGFSAFGLGFGSMISTFRNCPNNSPLALWWGQPNAPSGHPLKKWYPLMPRKTYGPGMADGLVF